MSAEELKEAVQQYADENVPGWTYAGVVFNVGPLVGGKDKNLLVVPAGGVNRDQLAGHPLSTPHTPTCEPESQSP